jgi:thioredoxin 1
MADLYADPEPSRAAIDAVGEPLLIEFGAPWCGHCQAAQPHILAALAAYPALRHLRIEDGKGRPLGRSFRVKLWPTLIFMAAGQEIVRVVRPTDAGVIAEALRQLPPTPCGSSTS